ncbi:MAG: hypothetical protein RIR52_833 [Acidobacteriota bacterium]
MKQEIGGGWREAAIIMLSAALATGLGMGLPVGAQEGPRDKPTERPREREKLAPRQWRPLPPVDRSTTPFPRAGTRPPRLPAPASPGPFGEVRPRGLPRPNGPNGPNGMGAARPVRPEPPGDSPRETWSPGGGRPRPPSANGSRMEGGGSEQTPGFSRRPPRPFGPGRPPRQSPEPNRP